MYTLEVHLLVIDCIFGEEKIEILLAIINVNRERENIASFKLMWFQTSSMNNKNLSQAHQWNQQPELSWR